jgi:hypothetical protein
LGTTGSQVAGPQVSGSQATGPQVSRSGTSESTSGSLSSGDGVEQGEFPSQDTTFREEEAQVALGHFEGGTGFSEKSQTSSEGE